MFLMLQLIAGSLVVIATLMLFRFINEIFMNAIVNKFFKKVEQELEIKVTEDVA